MLHQQLIRLSDTWTTVVKDAIAGLRRKGALSLHSAL